MFTVDFNNDDFSPVLGRGRKVVRGMAFVMGFIFPITIPVVAYAVGHYSDNGTAIIGPKGTAIDGTCFGQIAFAGWVYSQIMVKPTHSVAYAFFYGACVFYHLLLYIAEKLCLLGAFLGRWLYVFATFLGRLSYFFLGGF